MTDHVIQLPAQNGVRSLAWADDALIDWCAGGAMYLLDGTSCDRAVNYAFPFDAVTTSRDGLYAVIYQRLGTKGLVLRQGKVLREINRSFYHASVYEYPVIFAKLPDGREALVHCPERYNELRIEDAETGVELTPPASRKPADFFQSRLSTSGNGRWLASAGWIWHPFESVAVFDLHTAINNAAVLDPLSTILNRAVEIHSASFLNDEQLLLWSAADAEDFRDDEDRLDEPQPAMNPGSIGIYDLNTQRADVCYACRR
jgi:hypothetical protein